MLRVVDSGLQPPVWHLAASAALAERHRAGQTPDTLRFQFFPACALLGRHQVLAREVDTDWCAAHGVAVARRVTGGGAIVMAPGILGFELLLAAGALPGGIDAAAARICSALATALQGFGLPARYRPRNDVEVDGRKLCGTGGWFDGPTLLYQGTVLVRLDRELLSGALRWPGDKAARALRRQAAERVTDMETLLGHAVPMASVVGAVTTAMAEALGRQPVPAALTPEEHAATTAAMAAEIGTAAFIQGEVAPAEGLTRQAERRLPGGSIAIHLRLRPGPEQVIEAALVSGDVFVTPARALRDLEAALRDLPLAAAPDRARQALAGAALLGGDIAAVAELLASMGRPD